MFSVIRTDYRILLLRKVICSILEKMKEKNPKDVSPDIAALIRQNQADTQILPSEYLNDIAGRANVFKQMEEQKEPEECEPVIEVE